MSTTDTTPAARTSTTARRLRRGALLAGVAGATLVALPSAAFAAVASYSGPVAAGAPSICRQAYASYQARLEGTSNKDVSFTLYRDGTLLDWRVGSGFASEYRTSFGTFPGPGYYKVCITNNVGGGKANVTATIKATTDGNLF